MPMLENQRSNVSVQKYYFAMKRPPTYPSIYVFPFTSLARTILKRIQLKLYRIVSYFQTIYLPNNMNGKRQWSSFSANRTTDNSSDYLFLWSYFFILTCVVVMWWSWLDNNWRERQRQQQTYVHYNLFGFGLPPSSSTSTPTKLSFFFSSSYKKSQTTQRRYYTFLIFCLKLDFSFALVVFLEQWMGRGGKEFFCYATPDWLPLLGGLPFSLYQSHSLLVGNNDCQARLLIHRYVSNT